jgi:hypothetical protein
VRSQFLPDVKPDYAGYVAWRALVPERDVAPATRAVLEREYLFCVPEGELALCYVVPARDGDTRVGHRDYNLVWYRPADEAALAELCTDAQGRKHGGSVPPPLIRPEVVGGLRDFARAELPAPLVDTVLAPSSRSSRHPDLASADGIRTRGSPGRCVRGPAARRCRGDEGSTRCVLPRQSSRQRAATSTLARYDREEVPVRRMDRRTRSRSRRLDRCGRGRRAR